MCGIAAWISGDPIDSNLLKSMTDQVIHRGPDDGRTKIVSSAGQNVGLGHRRLAILDLTEAGQQPMHKGDNWIVYNGEIFNYLELKSELESCGYRFNSDSDTEVLLAAYEAWGERCLNRLNGMFAFVIVDTRRDKIFAARDRYGIKPIYYWKDGNDLLFASEIKQFTFFSSFPRVGNFDVIANFVVNRYFDYSEDTFFKAVKQIRPGHYISYDLVSQQLTERCWYDLSDRIATLKAVSPDEFTEIFEDSVRIRLRSDVEVGATLSGGLDSSSVTATADRLLRDIRKPTIRTVTASFDDSFYDEWPAVQSLVEVTGIQAERVPIDDSQMLEKFKQAHITQDEPIWSPSVLAQYLTYQAASKVGLKVMLGGQGADEIMCGYLPHIYPVFIRSLFMEKRIGRLAYECSAIRNCLRIIKLVMTGNKVQNNPFRSSKALSIFNSSNDINIRQINHRSANDNIMHWMQYHLPALLHYEDRNSMAFSIESRLPFLDHRFVEYVLKLDYTHHIKRGFGKALLREKMQHRIPKNIAWNRTKLGFKPPPNKWIEQTSDIIAKNISLLAEIPAFNRDSIYAICDDLRNGKSPEHGLINRLFSLSTWIQQQSVNEFA